MNVYTITRLTIAANELQRLLTEKNETPVSKRRNLLEEPTPDGLTSCYRHRGLDAAIGALAAVVRKILMESADISLTERNAIIVDCAERPLVQSEIALAMAGESLALVTSAAPPYPCLVGWSDEESQGWIVVANDAERTAARQCDAATDPDGNRWTPESYDTHWQQRMKGACLARGGNADSRDVDMIVTGILSGTLRVDVPDDYNLAVGLIPHSNSAAAVMFARSGNPIILRNPARPIPPLDAEG